MGKRSFSITRSGAIQIHSNIRKTLHEKELNPYNIILVHQHGRRVIVSIHRDLCILLSFVRQSNFLLAARQPYQHAKP